MRWMTVAIVAAWVGGTEAGLSRGLAAALLALSLAVLWLVPRGWAVALGVLLGALGEVRRVVEKLQEEEVDPKVPKPLEWRIGIR